MTSKTVTPAQRPSIGERIGRHRPVAARRELRVLVFAAIVCAAVAVPALASPVPGATYNGRTADGAYVRFTVSANGKQVDAYEITGVIGDTCQFSAEGNQPAFPGAPITGNGFTYGFDGAFSFSGKFNGAQSASGTYHFHRNAVGTQPGCDSGVVSWTATTTAKPGASPTPGGTSPTPGTSSTSGTPGTPGMATVKTRVSLRKMALARLGGQITAARGTCTRSRIVTLWRGNKKIRSTRSGNRGSYSFARTASVRGRRVHVTVAKSTVTGAICSAASSKTVGA
jgi:hypothetical protein